MRLIGIKLRKGTSTYLKKILREDTWYPFGDFEDVSKVKDYDKYVEKLTNRKSNGLYFITGEGGQKIDVNISCIVGKNGSGKSTIIDIMLAIINNYACEKLKKIESQYAQRLSPVSSVDASLYYVLNDKLYELECINTKTKLYSLTQTREEINNKDAIKIFSEDLFYTIMMNYSLYAFNYDEYSSGDLQKSGEWIHSLFYKNDGYVAPIVINPFRNHGNIDINRENDLACQRLSALSVQFASKGDCLVPGYVAVQVKYSIKKDLQNEIQKTITKWDRQNNERAMRALNSRKDVQNTFNDLIQFIMDRYPSKRERDSYLLLCAYLAYKVIKIVKTYAKYHKLIFGQDKEIGKGIEDFNLFKGKEEQLFSELEGDPSHIANKFKWVIKYLNKNPFSDNDVVTMDNLIEGAGDLSYWDACHLLPPPIYNMDILFEPKEGTKSDKDSFYFRSMSSGERQLLFSLSSVMYHIKNIESITSDENRIPYRNINIILDEVELYSHPEYQRDYIKGVLDRLSWIKIDSQKIDSINILVVTHSPFILSDICKENTLYLENGRRKETELTDSFGANYYDLLLNGFFLQEGGAVGAWAAEVFKSIVASKESTNTLQLEDDQKIKFAELFGDPLVSGVLKRRIIEIENKNKKKKS